jgi:GH24 family phage-related lysozyme (muramidase)
VSSYLELSSAKLREFEGCVNWMYRDTAGRVTVGIGLMLPNAAAACALPFLLDSEPVPPQQIAEEFFRVSLLAPGQPPRFYKGAASPQLPDPFIDAKLLSILTEFDTTLRAKIAGYDNLPDGVKLTLLDMAYNLGPAGLLGGYPKMLAAIESGAWVDAAADCARRGIGEARNAWARQNLLSGVVESIRAELGIDAESTAEPEPPEPKPERWFSKVMRELRKPMFPKK